MDNEIRLSNSSIVKVTKMKHLIEVQHMEKQNRQQNILKLDKESYVDLTTGEIKQFELNENRQQNINSLRKTMKKLRYLINNNFEGSANELHVTLTYAENMTDTERLYKDFKRFMTRLKRLYSGVSTIDYINVIEPQKRGAWHCHCLMRFNDIESVFIKSDKLFELWEQGFVKIKSLRDVDNIGAYLSAYLADIELETEKDYLDYSKGFENEVIKKMVDGQEKKFIKGARLHLYPSGLNLYRKSKGIVFPEREEMSYQDIKKIVGFAEPNYFKVYEHERLEDDYKNRITFIQYNLKR